METEEEGSPTWLVPCDAGGRRGGAQFCVVTEAEVEGSPYRVNKQNRERLRGGAWSNSAALRGAWSSSTGLLEQQCWAGRRLEQRLPSG